MDERKHIAITVPIETITPGQRFRDASGHVCRFLHWYKGHRNVAVVVREANGTTDYYAACAEVHPLE